MTCDKSLVTFSDFKVKKKSKKVSIQSMTFNWLFYDFLQLKLDYSVKKKSYKVKKHFLTFVDWKLTSQSRKSLLTFPEFSLTFSLTFYDFSVISQSNKMDLSQWKVREKSDISLTLHDFFLTFPSTFFDWNSTSQSLKSQLKTSKLLDFHCHNHTCGLFFSLLFLFFLSSPTTFQNPLQQSITVLNNVWSRLFYYDVEHCRMT